MCRACCGLIVTESARRSRAWDDRKRSSGSLRTILERENSRRSAAGVFGDGGFASLRFGSGRGRLGACSSRRSRGACAAWGSFRRRLRFLFQANDVLVGDFPPKMFLHATLLEALLQKYGAARIRHKCAGRRQKDVSGAVLHLNPAPKESRIAGHTVLSVR